MSSSEPEKSEANKPNSVEETEKSPSPADESKTAGLNGDKDMDIDENSSEINKEMENILGEEKDENKSEIPTTPSRKRKYNDLGELSDDSSPTEFLGFPDTRTEEEKKAAVAKKEKEEKAKLDLLAFDSAFGKGKRSRIPNKRYEGLTIRSFSKSSSRHTDNADDSGAEVTSSEDGRNEDENDLHKMDDLASEVSSSVYSSPSRTKSRLGTSPATPAHKKLKPGPDMSNPNYLKPFEFGWRRELVYRATVDSNMRRNGDIYYYSPAGRKIRSMRELTETLRIEKIHSLTTDDFTFFKEPVGINDPEREIIREAKYKSSTLLKQNLAKRKSLLNAKAAPLTETNNSKKTKSTRLGGFKVKITGSNKNERKRTSVDSDMEIGMLPPAWSPKKSTPGKQTNWQAKTGSIATSPLDSKPCRPCSIRCQGVSGLIPTLQCRLCLCLYHKECVGELSDDVPGGYVCKNCQMESQDKVESPFDPAPPIGPPPLTPISSLKSNNTQSATPPKLQRIPRPGEIPFIPKANEPSKSIVGSVTTWFPPNSHIKMNAHNSHNKMDNTLSTKPQSVVFMGERKFLVVPKGNVLSISPTIGAAASTPVSKPTDTNEMPALSPVLHPSASCETPAIPVSSDLPSASSQAGRDEAPKRTPAEMAKESQPEATPPKTRRGGAAANKKAAVTSTPVVKSDVESRFMQNYLQNLSYGYQTLLYVFQYLKVQDLLKAGCVCTLWRDIAGHPSLWKTVRMKNSQVSNWEGLADALKKHKTENLDLRKMLLPNSGDDMWQLFSKAIARVDSLARIELCRCPASVIEEIATSNPNLQVINAVMIRCESMDITSLKNLDSLQELRLKSTNGFVLTSDLSPLKALTKLKHLSLTSIKDLHKQNVSVVGELVNLESLDLGECSDFPENFGTDVITKLTKLEKMRLEKGQGSCCTFNILEAVSKIETLEQLELVNFDVKAGFDKALGACLNIKKLLIIPTYISQSATTNHMVLGGVIKLKSTLSHFVWGVTLELLRVTELFVDQCEDSPNKDKKKPTGNGDSIPVLKPVPIMKTEECKEEVSSKEPPQVEILPLPTLQKLLLNCLPTTRVKILKIPFHATWRQSIVDTVN